MDLNHIEAPDEAAAPRLLENEKRKKLQTLQLFFETPEEQAIRRKEAAKQGQERQQTKRKLESAEKAAERKLAHKKTCDTFKKKCAEKIKLETPEENAARRNKKREQNRKYQQKLKTLETPEKAAERQLAQKEYNKAQRKKEAEQNKLKTPEEKAAQNAKLAETARKYRQRRNALETPEEATIRRAKSAESVRLWKKGAFATPEKAAERQLARKKAYNTFKKKYAEKIMLETPEEKAARKIKSAEKAREYRQRRNVLETPEKATIRRAKAAETMTRWKIGTLEVQEKAAKMQSVKKISKKPGRKRQAKQVIPETPEEKAARCLQNSTEIKKERLTHECSTFDCTETSFIAQETLQSNTDIDSLLNGSTITSELQNKNDDQKPMEYAAQNYFALETPEPAAKRRALNRKSSLAKRAMFNSTEINQQLNDERSIFKYPETSSIKQETFHSNIEFHSLLDGSTRKETIKNEEPVNLQKRRIRKANEHRTVLLERLNCIKMLLDAEVERDEYLVYGEHIAAKLRDCYRDESEITIAKQHLETVLAYLNAGVYSYTKMDGLNTQKQDFMTSMTNIGLE